MDEVFCLYCQHEYTTPNRLRGHVLRKHQDTYRANAFLEEGEQVARKELTFGDAISAKDLKKGDEIIGVFIGSRDVPVTGRNEPSTIIELQGKDGPVSLWAPTGLKMLIPQLETGKTYVFSYEGKLKNPVAGRPDFHSFKVFEDDGVAA